MIAGISGAVIDNADLALTARVLIGIGSGGFATAAFALLGQRWHGPDRARMLGYVTAISAGAAIPLIILSGVVSQHFGWRTPSMLFGLALPLLLLSLLLPSDRRQRAPSPAGVLSALLFARLSRVIDRPRMTMLILVLYGGGFADMSVVHGPHRTDCKRAVRLRPGTRLSFGRS